MGGCGGVGGLCVTVTPPLSPGSHPEHAEPLLLARHQGRRAGGHLETSKRLHRDPGTRVQPGDELERVIGGRRGGAQRAVSPPTTTAPNPHGSVAARGTGANPTAGGGRTARRCARMGCGTITPAAVSCPGCARGSPGRARGTPETCGGRLEGGTPQTPVPNPPPLVPTSCTSVSGFGWMSGSPAGQ